MRTSPTSLTRVCLLAAGLLVGSQAAAATRYFTWDAGSGAETWNSVLSNWGSASGSQTGSTWGNYDDAVFEGTGGAVNASNIILNTITFNVNGYDIQGTLSEFGNPVTTNLTAASGVTGTISANITSTYTTGLRKAGAGTINLSGTNTATRVWSNAGVLGFTGGTTTVTNDFSPGAGGEIAISGGTINVAGVLSVSSNNFQANDGATSTLRVSGGALNVAGANFFTGRSLNGANLASQITQTGGAINYTNGSGWVGFADGGGNTQLDLSGGTFTSAVKLNLGVRGSVTMNISGTSVVTAPYIDYFYDNSVTGSGKTSVINLNGGELRTGDIKSNSNANTSNLVLNGGLLTATANSTINSNLSSVSLGAGGGRINTNGYTVNVGKALSGSGGLTKTGAGKLVLQAVSSFSGAVDIQAGTLEVGVGTASGSANALGSGGNAITVGSGATLLVSGGASATGRTMGYHTGAVAINGGTITFNTSDNSFASGKTITFDTAAGSITGTGQVRRRDASNTILVKAAASGSVISVADLNLLDSTPIINVEDGSQAVDLLISGGISGSSALNKNGAGVLSITGSNTNSGGLNVNGGTLVVSSTSGLGSGYVAIKNGSTLRYTGSGTESISRQIWFDTGAATIDVTQSTANLTFWRTSGGVTQAVTKSGSGTLRFGATSDNTGASATVSGGVLEAISSTGNNFAGVTVNSGGTFRIGTLDGAGNAVGNNLQVWDSGTVTVNSGGAFDLNGRSETVATLRLNGTGIGSGGALVNNGSGTSVITASSGVVLQSSASIGGSGNLTVANAVSGAGFGLTKVGAGVATLSAANTYTGATSVSNGTLVVNGSLDAASAVSVASGATLRGSGTVAGAVTAASGARLTAGDGAIGALTVGSLTFQGDATLNIGALSAFSSTAAIIVSGNIDLGSGAITVNLPSPTVLAGSYQILSFANSGTGIAGLVLGTTPTFVPGGRTSEGILRRSASGTAIEYFVAGDTPFWTGASSGAWDTSTSNWKTVNGKAATQYLAANDAVLFNDGYAGHAVTTTNVTIASEVTPLSVEFANSTLDYTFSGAAGIAGASTTLSKSGTGRVTINTANSFGGGTSVANGTLVLGSATALGSGAVTLNGGTLDVGGQSISNAITLNGGSVTGSGSLGGVVSETGSARSLTVANGATLTLAAANTYTGGTTVSSGGTLNLSGSIVGNVTNAGTFEVQSAFSGNVANTGTVRFNRATAGTYAGVISGTGGLTVTGNGKVTLTGANTYTGATLVQSGAALTIGNGSGSGSVGNTAITNDGALEILAGASGTASVGAAGALTGAGSFAASGRKVHLYSDITQSGAVTLTQLGAGGNYQDAIELKKAGTTTITAGSIAISGDVGKDDGDGNTLALDTSAANGTIDLDISLGRSGVMYIPAAFTANAGTGAINVTGTGMADSGWRLTPVTLTGGAITVSAAVNTNATLTIANSGASTVSGALSGSGALTKQGSGTLTLSAVGSRTGAITVSEGTLAITAATVTGNPASALGGGANAITVASGARLLFTGANTRTAGYHTGAVTINGGRITFDTLDNSLAAGNTLAFANAAGTIDGSGQWRLRDGANRVVVTSAASGSVISVAQLTLTTSGGTHTFEVADGASGVDLTVSSTINNYFGNESITKTGAGVLALTGSVAAPGGLTISAGTLQIGAGGTTGSVSGAIANNAALVFNRSDDLTYGSVLSGTGALTKLGNGVLTLTGTNTSFSGATSISGGTIKVGSLSALGSGAISVLSGGILDLNEFAITNAILFQGGQVINAAANAPAITITGNVSSEQINLLPGAEITIGAGATVDLSTVTKNLVITGAATLNNASAFSGVIAIAGNVDLSSAGSRPGAGATLELRSGGTLDFGSSETFSGTIAYKGGVIQGSAFAGTLAVTTSGVVLDDANLSGGTVAVGTGGSVNLASYTGSVTLTGAATVSGGLSTFSGTLELGTGSSLNLTSADAPNATVVVASGGTLRGTGSVGDTTLGAGGTLAPGNSPGTQTFASLAVQAGSAFDLEILNTGGGYYAPGAGTDYDTVVVSGLLDLSQLAGGKVDLNILSLSASTTAGDLQDFDPNLTYAFDLIQYGAITNYGGSISEYFNLVTTGLTFNGAAIDPAFLSLVDTGTAIQLQYAPIPEPSTYGLVLGGLALAGAAVRRRRAGKNSK